MTYYLKASNYQTTTLEKEDKEIIFQLKHSHLTSRKAIAELPDTRYEMEHANFWGSHYNIVKDGSRIGEVTKNWKGEILIHLKDRDYQPIQFKIKYKGVLNFQFEVWVNEKYHLMTLSPKKDSAKTYYRLTVHDIAYNPFPIKELMAIVAYVVWNKGF
ncbi:MAG: hypothetical protein AB8G86_07215 [Saprospiraceae bacterium]